MLEAVPVEVESELEVAVVPVGVPEVLGVEVCGMTLDVDVECEEADVVF